MDSDMFVCHVHFVHYHHGRLFPVEMAAVQIAGPASLLLTLHHVGYTMTEKDYWVNKWNETSHSKLPVDFVGQWSQPAAERRLIEFIGDGWVYVKGNEQFKYFAGLGLKVNLLPADCPKYEELTLRSKPWAHTAHLDHGRWCILNVSKGFVEWFEHRPENNWKEVSDCSLENLIENWRGLATCMVMYTPKGKITVDFSNSESW